MLFENSRRNSYSYSIVLDRGSHWTISLIILLITKRSDVICALSLSFPFVVEIISSIFDILSFKWQSFLFFMYESKETAQFFFFFSSWLMFVNKSNYSVEENSDMPFFSSFASTKLFIQTRTTIQSFIPLGLSRGQKRLNDQIKCLSSHSDN